MLRYFKKAYDIIKKDGIVSLYNIIKFKIKFKYYSPLISNKKILAEGKYNMRILYIVGCLEGESKRYRVYNLIEALNDYSVYAEWRYEIDGVLNNMEYVKQFDIIVLFRAAYSDYLRKLIQVARILNIPLVFDIDDLVFDSSIISSIKGIQHFDSKMKEEYLEGVNRYNKTLLECDYVTASTEYLCNYVKKYSKKGFLIYNGINNKQIEVADNLPRKEISPLKEKDQIIIGYLSGSKTHQKDFEQILPALTRIFNEYPNVYLKVIGFLDMDNYFPDHKYRIIKKNFVDYETLVIETSNIDINLSPLEMDNPFCDAKSELKYFEAALVNVPTVASPTHTFEKCITNGENGFIASASDEWYENIKTLIENADTYNKISGNAKEHIVRTYYPENIGKLALAVYEDICLKYKMRKIDISRLRISWVVPQPFEGSGGHRNIFRTIKYLSQFGHELKVYINPDNHRFSDSDHVKRFITENFMDLNAEVVWGAENITECDVMFATHWSTVYIVDKFKLKAFLKCYFMQDFEPYFYSMGYEYVMAYNTYKMGLYPITSGPWCTRLLEREFNVKGDFFRFPIDTQIYYHKDESEKEGKTKVIFFARPDMPRRCYQLGVDALARVKADMPHVEIIFYGANKNKYENIPFQYTNMGLLPSILALGDLYRSADVGIVFSTTNPSLVPYEMMACGCPVIDLDFNDNDANYGSRENVTLVEPNPVIIANAVKKLIKDKAYREKRITNALEYCKIFPTEEEMVRKIEGFVKGRIKKMELESME